MYEGYLYNWPYWIFTEILWNRHYKPTFCKWENKGRVFNNISETVASDSWYVMDISQENPEMVAKAL